MDLPLQQPDVNIVRFNWPRNLCNLFRKEWSIPNFKKSTKSVDVKNADTVCKYSLEKSLKTCSEHPNRLGAYFMVPF